MSRKSCIAVATGMILLLVAITAFAYLGLRHLSEIARLASCRPHLIQQVSEVYAQYNNGTYPPLSTEYGNWIYDTSMIEPYIFSITDHACENDMDAPPYDKLERMPNESLEDWSYVYLGYVIENETQGLLLVDSLEAMDENPALRLNAIPVPDGIGNCASNRLNRLESPDSPNFPACLDAAKIPVVIEWPGNHRQPGGKVVYLDGHSEYVQYPGKFPMTAAFIEALERAGVE